MRSKEKGMKEWESREEEEWKMGCSPICWFISQCPQQPGLCQAGGGKQELWPSLPFEGPYYLDHQCSQAGIGIDAGIRTQTLSYGMWPSQVTSQALEQILSLNNNLTGSGCKDKFDFLSGESSYKEIVLYCCCDDSMKPQATVNTASGTSHVFC